MASQPFTLRWGILATGNIATRFTTDVLIDPSTRNVSDIRHVVTAAASSTSKLRAETFLREVGAASAKAYGTYEELVHDDEVDIIYIATPHSYHYANVRLCLDAGKHVLVEKPGTVNAKQWEVVSGIARAKKLFLMEAMWTRFLPVTRRVTQFVQGGALGEVKRVWADFSCGKDVEAEYGATPTDRMVNLHLAGGVLLDLGIYSLTWPLMLLYPCRPSSVACVMSKFANTGSDDQTSVLLAFPGGAHGIATTSIRVAHDPSDKVESWPVRIQGTLGDLLVGNPPYAPTKYRLVPADNGEKGKLAGFGHETFEYDIPGGGFGMFWEADECARCVRDGRLESEIMGWQETEEVMRVMDECRRQGGLDYGEKLEGVEYVVE